jgi:transposase-like protein
MMCRVLNVSRSGYNAWKQRLNREPAPMKQRKQQRQEKVLKHFNASTNQSAGYRKVQRDVLEDGIQCCEETIRRDYKELGSVYLKIVTSNFNSDVLKLGKIQHINNKL